MLPDIPVSPPSRVVVVAEVVVNAEWQAKVSRWLARSGCLYMLAWGTNCSTWDDSVDAANIEQVQFDDIPEDQFIMTTWHADEPLNEAFWFAKHSAFHPVVDLERTVLLHISEIDNQEKLLRIYAAA